MKKLILILALALSAALNADEGNGKFINLTVDGTCSGCSSIPVSAANPMLLYAHFRDDDSASLYLDYSRDYRNFRPVRKGGSPSPTPIRDPSVYWDGATFFFLASPALANCQIQIWSSTNLESFTAPSVMDLSGLLSGCDGAWAPEWNPNAGGTGQIGIMVQLTADNGTTQHPYFIAYNPTTTYPSMTYASATAFTISGTAANQTFDEFPYYDAPSNTYYLAYVDHVNDAGCNQGFCQKIAYASSSTLTGTYTQQTAADSSTGADYFGFGRDSSEAPSIMPFDSGTSMALYGVADCLRIYADTWTLHYPGVRQYTWKYVDTCPATVGGNPFGVVMQAEGWTAPVNGIAAAAVGTAASSGAFALSLKSLGSGTLQAGDVFTVDGHLYVIQSSTAVSGGTATVSISPYLQTNVAVNDIVTSSIATPANISASEQGTVIKITDQPTANIVYKAEDFYTLERREEGRHTVGLTPAAVGFTPFLLTVNSNYDTGYLAYDQPAEIGAGGQDPGDPHNYSYAAWSACGIDPGFCPVPNGGDAKWIMQYGGQTASAGSDSQIYLSNATAETGESSIFLSNGSYSFAAPHPLTASTLAKQAQWVIGENNQNFGPMTGGTNTANNWFFVYNYGLGCVNPSTPCNPSGDPSMTNPGFESGSGLTGWTSTLGGTTANDTITAENGIYSASDPTSNDALQQTVSGLTNNVVYEITAWVKTSGGTANGYLVLDDGTGANLVTGVKFNPGAQWYQIGHQYTANSTGQVRISLSRDSGSGVVYWDNVRIRAGQYPGGSFPFGISASTGEVRANYGFTLGQGDTTYQASIANIGLSSPAPGILDIGAGRLGDANASVLFGTANLTTLQNPAFDDSFSSLRIAYQGGAAAESIGDGIVFAQQYSTASPTATVRTGGIFGYKETANGNYGGGLVFYSQAANSSPMVEAALLDDTQVLTLLNGYAAGPIGAPYGNLYTPSAGTWNMGNGTSGSSNAVVNGGTFNAQTMNTSSTSGYLMGPLGTPYANISSPSSGLIYMGSGTGGSSNAIVDGLTFNAQTMNTSTTTLGYLMGPLGSPYANIFAPSAGVIDMGNGSSGSSSAVVDALTFNAQTMNASSNTLGYLMGPLGSPYASIYSPGSGVVNIGNGTSGSWAAGVNGGSFNATSSIYYTGGSSANVVINGTQFTGAQGVKTVGEISTTDFFNAGTFLSSPDIGGGNLFEGVGTVADCGNAYLSAKSYNLATIASFGSTNGGSGCGTAEGFAGTYTGTQFSLRTGNADRLTISAAGTVLIPGSTQLTGQVIVNGALAGVSGTPQLTVNGNETIGTAGQPQLDLHNSTTGGTPSNGAYWREFADNVGGGGGNLTWGMYDLNHARVALGIDDSGRIGVETTTPAHTLDIAGDVGVSGVVWMNYASADIDAGNKVELIGASGVASGNSYVSAKSYGGGVLAYMGTSATSSPAEGFVGSYNNAFFSVRQNNTDLIQLSGGGVAGAVLIGPSGTVNVTVSGELTVQGISTSGSGGEYVCVTSAGAFYKKSSCP